MPPWLVFALVLALAAAAFYQIVTRRFGWRVLAYWIVIVAGIMGAEAVAETLGWNFTRFGDLRLLPDLLGASVVMLVLWYLGV